MQTKSIRIVAAIPSAAVVALAPLQIATAANVLFQADFNGTPVSDVGNGLYAAQITAANLDAGTAVGSWTVHVPQDAPAAGTARAQRGIQGVGAADVENKALRFGINLAGQSTGGADPILSANLATSASVSTTMPMTVGFDYANGSPDGGDRSFFLRGLDSSERILFELAFKHTGAGGSAEQRQLHYRDGSSQFVSLGNTGDESTLVNTTQSGNVEAATYDPDIMKRVEVVIGSSAFDILLDGSMLAGDIAFQDVDADGLTKLDFASTNQWTGGWFDNMEVTQIPEPSAAALLALGGLALLSRRR